MNIDWSHMIWQGRWDALVLFWNAAVTDATTIWWFGPLLLILLISAGRKKLVRLMSYVVRVFAHTHTPS
jgi:hypothetical protein